MLIQIYPAFHQANNSSRMQRTSLAYAEARPNEQILWFGLSHIENSTLKISDKIDVVNLYVTSKMV
ncbi:MAG: hypothetical protein IPK03_01850 [Bacteroidetes bacterium]|nr:hypothetical protein [Bacteroidota bacterium]